MPNGTVYDLKPGQHYRVRTGFADHYGGHFEAGTMLTFQKRDFLPYHGGHTLQFAEQTIYLQEEENADILQNLWNYLEAIR